MAQILQGSAGASCIRARCSKHHGPSSGNKNIPLWISHQPSSSLLIEDIQRKGYTSWLKGPMPDEDPTTEINVGIQIKRVTFFSGGPQSGLPAAVMRRPVNHASSDAHRIYSAAILPDGAQIQSRAGAYARRSVPWIVPSRCFAHLYRKAEPRSCREPRSSYWES